MAFSRSLSRVDTEPSVILVPRSGVSSTTSCCRPAVNKTTSGNS